VWEVGDWWTYNLVGSTSGPSSMTLVVATVAGTYEVRPTDNRSALRETLVDLSFVGNIGLDLSGDDAGSRARFFDWPLEDGKSWGMTIDGRSTRVTAKLNKQVWDLVAREGNQTVVKYTYDPKVKWFTRVRFGADEAFGVDMNRAGNGFVGDVFSSTATERYSYTTGGTAAGSFTINPGASVVAVLWAYQGGPNFAASARLVDPKGGAFEPFPTANCVQAACVRKDGIATYNSVPGNWAVNTDAAGTGSLFLKVYEVVDVRKRVG